MLDALGAMQVADGATLIARPWAWRRPDGTWTAAWYQLQLRYERRTRYFSWRADAGVLTSPIGLGAALMRADQNPLLSPPFYYVAPLPRFDSRFDGLQMMSGGYPLGGLVTASGTHWDIRGGVTDSTPARPQSKLKANAGASHAQVVVGGGITPMAGLRFGAGFARGRYRGETPAFPGAGTPPATATVLNLEGEYAWRYTRLSGEWVRDTFDTTARPVHARAGYLQAVQTLTPRWFAAARHTQVAAPQLAGAGTQSQRVTEATIGYRVTPAWTIRAGAATQRSYLGRVSRQIGVSLVWAERW
jgi:hypothetical protein